MSDDYLMASGSNTTLAYSAMMVARDMRNYIKASRKMSGDKLRNEQHEIAISKKYIIKCAQILTQRAPA